MFVTFNFFNALYLLVKPCRVVDFIHLNLIGRIIVCNDIIGFAPSCTAEVTSDKK